MQQISFSGLASGLDTTAIINSLVQVERIPILQLESQKSTQQSKLDLIGTLKGHLEDLKAKAEELQNLSGFLAYTVEASQEGIASFTTNGDAIAGSHTLNVQSVATADRYAFDAVIDPNATIGATGEALSFEINSTNYQINIPAGGFSLNSLAGEINSLAGVDVTASVVNTGTEQSPAYQLVLASNNTGEDFRITNISSNVTGLGIDTTPPDANGNPQSANHITVGNNAVAIIDGLTVERSTNDFSDVIEGVTINAISADPDTTINFTVAPDTEEVKAGVKELVDAYNKVITFINGQSQFTEEEGASGDLFGDSILRSVRSAMSNAFFDIDLSAVQNDTEGFSTLSLVGIDLSNDGTLTINDAEFDEKLAENLNAVADLFVDLDGFDNGGALENTPAYSVDVSADSGLTASLIREIERLIDNTADADNNTIKSIFNARTESIQAQIKRFDDQIEVKERFLERFEENLVTRFTALETLMGQLNAQGASLTALNG